jgi:IclR family KDG regulon transcriptional repressor
MPTEFKRVPAIDRCFAILQFFARSKRPLGISEIARELGLYKGTVFNAVHTLSSLDILEQDEGGKFRFGTTLYMLGNTAGRQSELIQTVHPYLEKINRKTKLSAFLGIRAGLNAVIIDKVDAANDVKISSEVGMRLPLLAAASGKALLSLLPDETIDRILSENNLEPYTPHSITDKDFYKNEIIKLRDEGIAFEDQEYIQGIVAFAVPIKSYRENLQAAVWVVGVKDQVPENHRPEVGQFIRNAVDEINSRFS